MKECVLYQFDNNYAGFAGVSITSLCENNPEDITIYALVKSVSEENLSKLRKTASGYGKELVLINAEDIDAKLNALEVPSYRGSQATNYKLFLTEYIPADVDRILYIDSDTVVEGNISDLFAMDLGDNALGMVIDSVSIFAKQYRDFSREEAYFNAGVILYDLGKLREMDYHKKMVEEISKGKLSSTPDQDYINIVLKNRILRLPPKYNLQPVHFAFRYGTYMKCFKPASYYSEEILEDCVQHPVILHTFRYIGEFPWNEGNVHPNKDNYLRYKAISQWADEPQRPGTTVRIHKVEKLMYKILPRGLYLRIFVWMFNRYTRKMIAQSRS